MSGRVLLLLGWAVTLGLLVVGEVVIAIAGKGEALTLYNAAIVGPVLGALGTLLGVVALARTGRSEDR